jgi:hypothetical protein
MMKITAVKKALANGLALAVPLGIVFYAVLQLIRFFEKLLGPLSKKFGVEKILGELTLTIFAAFILLLFVFLLGLLMRFSFMKIFSSYLEEIVLKIFPSFAFLKTVGAEKLGIENVDNTWRPVLVQKTNECFPAFLIEEKGEWINLVKVKAPNSEIGDILIVRKEGVELHDITHKEMKALNKQYGKGYLPLVL